MQEQTAPQKADVRQFMEALRRNARENREMEFEERPKTDFEHLKKGSVAAKNLEIKEAFVNKIAEMMVRLGENGEKWEAGWNLASGGLPFCAATGRPYSGVNSMMLMLTQMVNNYSDSRWVTFKQMDAVRAKDPDKLKGMHVKKGEKGTALMRPDPVYYTIDPETGKMNFLNQKEAQEILAANECLPEEERTNLNMYISYRTFTVFNADQIKDFPKVETDAKPADIDRDELVERFIASSGVKVRHKGNQPCYAPLEDKIYMPLPSEFFSTEEYYAAKLHEFFHATGHENRENRDNDKYGKAAYAYEEMRAELFSAMASAQLGLPMTQENSAAYIKTWNKKFSGGDANAVFNAAKEASKVLTLLAQFRNGEQPVAEWFPKMEEWPELLEAQNERDIEDNVEFAEEEEGFRVAP